MKFTITSLCLLVAAASAAADAENANHHGHRHASFIADVAGNTAFESFHQDFFQASQAITQHKEARARSLRVLASKEDVDGMSKADLKEELKKCQAARLAPSILYVQTADTCRLRARDDGTYTLKSTDVDGTTWLFTDKPFKIESSLDTASFVADFDETFPRQPPNFALTAVLPLGKFDEPLVAVMEKADMAGDGTIVKYKIRQSKSQAGNGISLTDVLGDVGDGINLEYCSFFIDATSVECCELCFSGGLAFCGCCDLV